MNYAARQRKARRVLTSHLPKHERQLLEREFACLEACAFVFDFKNLTQAYEWCVTLEWMQWLVDVLKLASASNSYGFWEGCGDTCEKFREYFPTDKIQKALSALARKKGKKR